MDIERNSTVTSMKILVVGFDLFISFVHFCYSGLVIA